MFVYTIQPVVNPDWQPVASCIQTFNRLSNPYTAGCQTGLYNRFDNRVERTVADKRTVAVRSTRLSNPFKNRLDVCLHDTAGCQTSCTTGCIVYTGFKSCRPTSAARCFWWSIRPVSLELDRIKEQSCCQTSLEYWRRTWRMQANQGWIMRAFRK